MQFKVYFPVIWFLLASPAFSTTLLVDPGQADGVTRFANLNQAAEYLVNNALNTDGQADTIKVTVDNLTVGAAPADGGVLINGTDDFTLDGDGDANGIWCTVVTDNNDFNGSALVDGSLGSFIRIRNENAVAWNARVTIRNLIVIPPWIGNGLTTTNVKEVITCDLGNNPGTTGSVLLENLVCTGRKSDGTAANPFDANWLLNTRWAYGGFAFKKATNSQTTGKTLLTCRNTIFSHMHGRAVQCYGDNTQYTFGPGWIVTNTREYALESRLDVQFSTFALSGQMNNRNLVYNMGYAGYAGHLFNADGEPTNTLLTAINYTDFLGGVDYQRALRLDMECKSITNCLFAGALTASGGYINTGGGADSGAKSMTVKNCTFFNLGPLANARQIQDLMVSNSRYENVIFAAGNNEATSDNANCDIAVEIRKSSVLDYCLFPENGPNRLRGPYGSEFPPDPVTAAAYIASSVPAGVMTIRNTCRNSDPQFASTTLSDYPFPAGIAAWVNSKIKLDGSAGYLRPLNSVLQGKGPAGANLQGAWTVNAETIGDLATQGLWLFDDVDYLNGTLTDASSNWTDLRLVSGRLDNSDYGKVLVAGAKFGPAAVLANPACIYDGGRYGILLRPTSAPLQLESALQSGNWTLEFRLKANAAPTAALVLLEMGENATPDFRVDYDPTAGAFQVYDTFHGSYPTFPVTAGSLANGQWRHVAFVRESNTIRCYLDGVSVASGVANTSVPTAAYEGYAPGLPALRYNDTAFSVHLMTQDYEQLAHVSRSSSNAVRSERVSGYLTSPVSGQVGFSAINQMANTVNVRLILGGTTVMDSQNPASWNGTHSMTANQPTSFALEWSYVSGTNNHPDLTMFWTLPGNTATTIPVEVFSHTKQDLRDLKATVSSQFTDNFDYSLVVGWRALGAPAFEVTLDELRLSSESLYSTSFTPPASFAKRRNTTKGWAAGPVPLFDAPGVLPFGARKHLFIDESIVDQKSSLTLTMNPPVPDQTIVTPRGVTLPHFFEQDGVIKLLRTDNNLWLPYPQPATNHYVWGSTDGIHFSLDQLPGNPVGTSVNGVNVLTAPVEPTLLVDTNPAVPAEERYKLTTMFTSRGLYLFTSPDGMSWKRNESILMPFDTGGSCETFWDDQRGVYVSYNRCEAHWSPEVGTVNDPGGRAFLVSISADGDATQPFPFTPRSRPSRRDLLTEAVLTPSELPLVFGPTSQGEVYMTRAMKYPYAPDTYLAFLWRLTDGGTDHEARQVELNVSRDGVHWTAFTNDYYMANGIDYNGITILDLVSADGMIRRGDELWQYAELRDGYHGQAATMKAIMRYKQRLDGFASIDAGPTQGWLVTKPLTFTGDQLRLNVKVNSGGMAKVGLLDASGNPLPGFGMDDCDPIQGDATNHLVSWNGQSNIHALSDQTVKLKFELTDAKLYAFEIKRNGSSVKTENWACYQ